jgi:phosphonate transport system substrate-binding protein
VGARLGIETELLRGRDHRGFADGAGEVAFMCSPLYLDLADRDEPLAVVLAAPQLSGPRYAGRPVYFSDVIVGADEPPRAFADLRGRAFAYNEPWSFSGHGCVLAHLARIGATEAFFSKTVWSGYHRRSIRLVRGGAVDAAAIDSQVLAVALRDDPTLADEIRVIGSIGPSPIQPVVASTRIPAGLREDVRGALLAIHEEPRVAEALAFGYVERFVATSDESYDPIRDALRLGATARFGDAATRGAPPGPFEPPDRVVTRPSSGSARTRP